MSRGEHLAGYFSQGARFRAPWFLLPKKQLTSPLDICLIDSQASWLIGRLACFHFLSIILTNLQQNLRNLSHPLALFDFL